MAEDPACMSGPCSASTLEILARARRQHPGLFQRDTRPRYLRVCFTPRTKRGKEEGKAEDKEKRGQMGRFVVSVPLVPLALLLFISCRSSLAQAPIPAEYDGFPYGGWRPWGGSSVVVEAFLDPMCPDSRDAWPPLKRALEYYFPRLALLLHPFPLPYHDNSYVTCRALHIANMLNASATYPLLELFFEYQERYYNAPTQDMSRASIVDKITKLAALVVGNSSLSALQSGFEDGHTDAAARVSFRYGCSRGVTGTPFFFVNGFPLPNSGSALDYNQWRSIIDPLIGEQWEKVEEPLVSFI